MNTFKIFSILFIVFILPVNAQINTEDALGLRVGDNDGLAFELSYQRYLTEVKNQRLEFGLGLKDSHGLEYIKLVGLYELVSKLAGDYRWYVGAGGGIGAFKTDLVSDNLGLVAGVIGIEHSTPTVPILFSLDFRPEYGFNDDYSDGIDFNIGLSMRIQF
tara:strand:+ start:18080 stop:18559 length:480 start_codon:yes stop_codon:yes gene_type:complete